MKNNNKNILLQVRLNTQTAEALTQAVTVLERSQADILRDAIALGIDALMEVQTSPLDLLREKIKKIRQEKNGK